MFSPAASAGEMSGRRNRKEEENLAAKKRENGARRNGQRGLEREMAAAMARKKAYN
jgi:hypothetical protein